MTAKSMRLKGVKGFAFEGAVLNCVDDDGEIHTMPIPAGPVDFTRYADLVKFFEVTAEKICITQAPQGRLRDIKNALHRDTAANQSFTPSLDYQNERNMKRLVAEMIQAERKKARRKPRNPKPEKPQETPKPEEKAIEKPAEPATEKPDEKPADAE